MGLFYSKIALEVSSILKAKHSSIQVEAGLCRLNRRCHENAVHDAVAANQDKIVMCLAISKTNHAPFIHFVNYDSQLNKYLDNTFGYWTKNYDYYLLREVPKEDFDRILTIFTDYKKVLKSYLPFWMKLFFKFEDF